MSTAARIEELRKKFDENPRRYFAPLANELRKAGDLSQAISLCREHLPKQPGHMSGYIVFGQALYEAESLDEARAVFEQALALDPENLIALRHLGDIARRQGDPSAARRWYERVLEADPRNDDIAAHLTSLATPPRAVPGIPAPELDTPDVPVSEVPLPVEREASFPVRSMALTPAEPVPLIGTVMPTPDAALRAVDFDEVNARLLTPTLASVSELPPAPMSVPAPVASAPPQELLDLESIEDAVQSDEADPFAFAGESGETGQGEQDGDLSFEEMSFEEGLAAPHWPDTSELVARVVTPRTVTPPAVEVPMEAVDAFGREATDPVAMELPAPEPDVADEELAPVAVTGAQPAVEQDEAPVELESITEDSGLELEQESTEQDSAEQDSAELPWLSAPVTPTAEVEALADAIADDARNAGDSGAVSVFAHPIPHAPDTTVDSDEASFSHVHPEAGGNEVGDLGADFDDEPGMAFEAITDGADSGFVLDGAEVGSSAFVTETMGELLVAQGFTDRAITVYEELVRRHPYDPVLSSRLMELRDMVSTVAPVEAAPQPVASARPAYTARQRFAALAARRVPRRTPRVSVAVPPVENDALSALFGSSVAMGSTTSDEAAARALADAFAPQHFDDRDTPDSLFATPAASLTPATATPVFTPAFGSPMHTPVSSSSASSSSDAAITTSADFSSDFSFDRFFPDPAAPHTQKDAGAAAPPAADAPPAPSATDDLAQFSAWLKGLGNA